ncbi:MAG TPA: hypothetical protein VGN81_39520 [Pseudonocardiaceae bacterium]
MTTRTVRFAVTLAGAGLAAIVVAAPASAAPATSGGGCASDSGLTACIGPGRHSGHLQGEGRGNPNNAIMWTDIVQLGTDKVIASAQGTEVDGVPPGPGQYVADYYCATVCGEVTSPVINYP